MANLGASTIEQAIRDGRAFRLSVFRTQTILGGRAKLVLTTSSSKKTCIYSSRTFSYLSTAGAMTAQRFATGATITNGPTVDLVTGAKGAIINLNSVMATTPGLSALYDAGAALSTAMGGGTKTRDIPVLANNYTVMDDNLTIIAPSTRIGLEWGGGSLTMDFAYEILFFEEA